MVRAARHENGTTRALIIPARCTGTQLAFCRLQAGMSISSISGRMDCVESRRAALDEIQPTQAGANQKGQAREFS